MRFCTIGTKFWGKVVGAGPGGKAIKRKSMPHNEKEKKSLLCVSVCVCVCVTTFCFVFCSTLCNH